MVVLLTVFGLALGPSVAGQKVGGSMTIACHISLDDDTDIDFTRLSVSIQHRLEEVLRGLPKVHTRRTKVVLSLSPYLLAVGSR